MEKERENQFSNLKEAEIEYEKARKAIFDAFQGIQNESYLNQSLEEMKNYINENYNKKEEESTETSLLEQYHKIIEKLKEKENNIFTKEEEEKLLKKEKEIKDQIQEISNCCDKLLDEILNYDDEELRLLREKKQRRKILSMKISHNSNLSSNQTNKFLELD